MPTLHLTAGAEEALVRPQIRSIRSVDLKDALTDGSRDFLAMPTHIMFKRGCSRVVLSEGIRAVPNH